MARLVQQLPFVQASFEERIRQKVQTNKIAVKDRVADSIPLIGGLLAPLAGFVFDIEQGRNEIKGERGERQVADNLLWYLPDSWVMLHNAIIEPQPDVFAQIDILLIGPAGLFLVETKAWRGSFTAYRDEWKRRDGRQWIACSSPTKQVMRHTLLVKRWLQHFSYSDMPAEMNQWIKSFVVFTHVEWLRATSCTIPIFVGTNPLLNYLTAQPIHLLDSVAIESLTNLFVRTPTPPVAPPCPLQPQALLCPRCGIPMILRTSRQGKFQGQQFYGCSNFPTCRAMIQLESK